MAPALDLSTLEAQLRETKAIGVFTKITLKNQVDDLLDKFRDYYQGKAKFTLADLRRSYDLLMMKVLSLLQDADQKLASAIVSSREAIWGLFADPKKFARDFDLAALGIAFLNPVAAQRSSATFRMWFWQACRS